MPSCIEISLLCYTWCITWPQFLRSHSKDLPNVVVFYDKQGIPRTYSWSGLHRTLCIGIRFPFTFSALFPGPLLLFEDQMLKRENMIFLYDILNFSLVLPSVIFIHLIKKIVKYHSYKYVNYIWLGYPKSPLRAINRNRAHWIYYNHITTKSLSVMIFS